MPTSREKEFDKYKKRGNRNWEEMMSRDPRVFNAYQQARYEWIIKIVGDVRGKKILDVGSGGGSLTFLLAKAGAEVIGVDNEEVGLRFAKENLKSTKRKNLCYTFVGASAYDLPFPSNSFDAVVSCEVVEHLQEPEKMVSEAYRVLKMGGKFVLSTPYKMTEVPQDLNHVKEYYPGDLEKMLRAHFTDVESKPTHHMLWRSLYTYSFRRFYEKPLGKWLLNSMVLLFGWNPFTIDYKPKKFDLFSSIIAWGIK